MDCGLAGRGYVVTGGSRGLGRATAECLVRDGADVLVVGRDPDQGARTAGELTGLGAGTAYFLAADLADPDAAESIRVRAREELDTVDGAVLSVGGPPAGRFRERTDQEWRAAFEQVHLGPLRVARALLEDADRPIAVTFVLSTSVRSPLPEFAISNGLRPGLAMAAKTMADEYGPDGHRVNCLLPGRFDTDRVRALDEATGDPAGRRAAHAAIVPLGRLGQPEEFGAVAAFVTSPIASYMTGSVVTVDGGQTRTI
ncbi:SDR family oxidoreductase [Ornithinimicrobium sp. F0845]|uniref:SDR family oxidoreductase n=1 Tax=Ornithinimicrobium sp. F0845 TaxID=2926412 RepID=UPI001FF230D2|nr:SDR family oxidoreductase [Ornithinimicrobium sp. F0845]MCK0113763.1 SDR family oxidoreductase [Ornithinimicrobium sp. F0845]